MAPARRCKIGVVLTTEPWRWGRSTIEPLTSLRELEMRLVALTGMAFDLSTPLGRMMATVLAGVTEFERELTQEPSRSGIPAAKARGRGDGPSRTAPRRRSSLLWPGEGAAA